MPRGLLDARAEHVARKRCLAVLRAQPTPVGHAMHDVLAAAGTARTLLHVACCSQRFERSCAALERAPTLAWLLGAALAALQLTAAQATGRVAHSAELAQACAAVYAALGAVAVRFGELPDPHGRDGGTVLLALHRVTSVLAQRCGGEAAALMCATAALAAAPLRGFVPTAARVPAAGPCPAGTRLHEGCRARARRETRAGGLHLLSGSWSGRRGCCPEADAGDGDATRLPATLPLSLGMSVQEDGSVSGFGSDALSEFDIIGRVQVQPMPLPQLHARVSLRVTYRSCGWLPGAIAEHTVPGAAPQAWEAFVWPFGIVGAWAPEAPRAAGGTPQWTRGGTFMLWPKS